MTLIPFLLYEYRLRRAKNYQDVENIWLQKPPSLTTDTPISSSVSQDSFERLLTAGSQGPLNSAEEQVRASSVFRPIFIILKINNYLIKTLLSVFSNPYTLDTSLYTIWSNKALHLPQSLILKIFETSHPTHHPR
jgi:hypothetical protein